MRFVSYSEDTESAHAEGDEPDPQQTGGRECHRGDGRGRGAFFYINVVTAGNNDA